MNFWSLDQPSAPFAPHHNFSAAKASFDKSNLCAVTQTPRQKFGPTAERCGGAETRHSFVRNALIESWKQTNHTHPKSAELLNSVAFCEGRGLGANNCFMMEPFSLRFRAGTNRMQCKKFNGFVWISNWMELRKSLWQSNRLWKLLHWKVYLSTKMQFGSSLRKFAKFAF